VRTAPLPFDPAVAYFSMEVAVDDAIPTYCGGLGVLAGDHLRSSADLELPVVGITLLYRQGYFDQRLDDEGHQREAPVEWWPENLLEPLDATATISVCGRAVQLRAWRTMITGVSGHQVPVLFLDTGVEENDEQDRTITDALYSGDNHHRLRQEAVLGLGGIAMLASLGATQVRAYHMNEGHSALLTLGLIRARGGVAPAAVEWVRGRGVFTTHTPVPEGHDEFDEKLVRHVLGQGLARQLSTLGSLAGGQLNMTRLGMQFSRFVNGVSLQHGAVSRSMFPDVPIRSITNGVHARTWVAPPVAVLFDRHLPGWRQDNALLRSASTIPLPELAAAHQDAKRSMVAMVAERAGVSLDPGVLTLGLARRAVPYKRLDLLLRDPEQLRSIAETVGPVQIVYSGKAPPPDEGGRKVILRIFEAAKALRGAVAIVYLENYSLELAGMLCAGTDVWVNTPAKPYEASGTSGMKAALNGVPSLSVRDGWWLEGHVEGVTGWSIGGDEEPSDDATEADELYSKLEKEVASLFYGSPLDFTAVGRGAIALNGSYFTTERMVRQYDALAYRQQRPERRQPIRP
jgi:glycogen phosphorylase